MGKSTGRIYLVWMKNSTNRQDDEIVKAFATSPADALKKASKHQPWRFCAWLAIPARGGTKDERETAREMRTFCPRNATIYK